MDLLREKLRAQGLHKPCVAAAVIGSAVVGGAMSASASKNAANTQAGAANKATQAQQDMFNQTANMEAPFRDMGQDAGAKLANLLGIHTTAPTSAANKSQDNFDAAAYLAANPDVAHDRYYASHPYQHYQDYGQGEGRSFTWAQGKGPDAAPAQAASDPSTFGSLLKPFGMEDFQLDPGIQFQTQQGSQALMNSQAAKNGVLSGGALKDLIAYNQGMAGTGYQSAFDRYMANKNLTLGSLMGMTNLGQAAAGNTVNSASGFSNGMANTITGAGNAQAAGIMGSANAITGGLQGASNGYMLNSLLKGNQASTSSPSGVVADDAIANYA